ncbi:tetratricopeptide repeat protein [Methanophagales archaeon]|nr:MAG: tetratricopeptide repeat protein [Methanophagales archaeon]
MNLKESVFRCVYYCIISADCLVIIGQPRKAKKLQQNDFAIQQPLNANTEVYKRRGSDEEIENSLKNHEYVLVTGKPKSGKTRSVYEAIKAVFPDFFVIKVPPKKVEQIRFPFMKRNYLAFFDDLNKFSEANFDFNSFLKRVKEKTKKLIVVSTCRSGDEFESVKEKSMETMRTFTKVVNLDKYELSEIEGRELAEEAGVKWKSEQFLGTPGSVILDIEDMKNRYGNSTDDEKTILRACKLLKRANIFTYEKELIGELCTSIFETKINESSWIKSINHLKENSLVTKSSIPEIDVYDATLESVVDDYDPVYHLEALLNLLITLDDAENLFYLGNAFLMNKSYKNGEKSYKECLRINPESTEAHNNLGVLLKDLGRYEESEREWREAIRIKPESAEAHYNLGLLLYNLKRYKESEAEYREAIRINPDDAEAHYNLGLLLHDLKRYEESETEYREAIRINLDDAAAHYNLGILLHDLKRYEESETEYREAIRINPDDAEAYYNLGILLKDLKRYEESETEYREAIRIKPDDAAAHANLGILFLFSETGKKEEAKKELRTAKELFEREGREEDVKHIEELLKSL